MVTTLDILKLSKFTGSCDDHGAFNQSVTFVEAADLNFEASVLIRCDSVAMLIFLKLDFEF